MRYSGTPRSTSFSRWLLAAIIFIAIMTFADKEVFGVGTPITVADTTKLTRNYDAGSDESNIDPQNPGIQPENGTPGGVPEPATLFLMGSGLAAAWALRRKMNK